MNTIDHMLAVIGNIAQAKQELLYDTNQISAYEIERKISKLTDELVDLYTELERDRLKACDEQTKEEAEREANFAIDFINKHHRPPTFSDAIELTRKETISKAYKWLYRNLTINCEEGDCETIEQFKREMEL